MKLQEFTELPVGWDSYSGKPTDKAAAERAWLFAQATPCTPWWTVPCSDGSVQLELHAGGVDIEIYFDVGLDDDGDRLSVERAP